MKKILVITETSKTLDEIKSQTDFTKGIFTLFHPYVETEFEVQKNSYYYQLHHNESDYNSDFGVEDKPEISDIENYEEFSEELNDLSENMLTILKQKYPEIPIIDGIEIEIHTFNYHPFFIYVKFDAYNESFKFDKEIELCYEVHLNV